MQKFLGLLLGLLLCISCNGKKLETNYNKTAFFLNEDQLVVLDTHSAYLYNWKTQKKDQTLYTAPDNGTLLCTGNLNCFDTTDYQRHYLAFFEKGSKKEINFILYYLNTGSFYKLALTTLPTAMQFFAKDRLEIRCDKTAKTLIFNPLSKETSIVETSTKKVYQPWLNVIKHFSPYYTSNQDATITGQQLQILDKNLNPLWTKQFHSGRNGVLALNFSPNGSKLVVGGSWYGQLGSLFIYESQNGHLLARILGANDK